MSTASCKAGSVCGQLVNYYPGSAGTASNTWLSSRPHRLPYTSKDTNTNPIPSKSGSSGETRQQSFLKMGLYARQPPKRQGLSDIFFLSPKGGGQRPVINLKALNRFIRWEHFQMEGLHMLPDMLTSNNWMISWTSGMRTYRCLSIQTITSSYSSNGKA